jgi:hypothetical protein
MDRLLVPQSLGNGRLRISELDGANERLTRDRRIVVSVLILSAILFSCSSASRGSTTGDLPDTFNYAFATQLGSGVYSVKGRSVQIYRISSGLRLRDPENGRLGLLLRLPVTFGFYGFKTSDVIDSNLPSSLGTLAFVPSLEFEVAMNEDWWLIPFGGAGAGKDFSGGVFNYIYALGIRSLAVFSANRNTVRLGNRLVYTGYTNGDMDFVDDFAFLETGLEIRKSMGFELGGMEIDAGLFGMNYIYMMSPHFVRMVPEPVEMRTQWELGMSFGTTEPWTVIRIRMPRIGLSYRFGTGADALRLIIGNPFQMDSPDDRSPGME